jgi:hypothetical protein
MHNLTNLPCLCDEMLLKVSKFIKATIWLSPVFDFLKIVPLFFLEYRTCIVSRRQVYFLKSAKNSRLKNSQDDRPVQNSNNSPFQKGYFHIFLETKTDSPQK